MASLLVYLEPERLAALLPEYRTGDTWMVPRHAITSPQLERLDEHSWLVVVSEPRFIAVVRKPRIDGTAVSGSAIVYDRELEDVLIRLGCVGGIAGLAHWAAIPRVLPPSDLDLLRYTLSLADDDESIGPVLPDDAQTLELRAAIWEDPDSDDARMVYADYLQDRGDPRGELVALQVMRVRAGELSSDRELQLLRRIAADCAQPLAPYLVPGFQLARGFVRRCTVNDAPMPEAIVWSPAWRTVDDLTTTRVSLLLSPHVRATRVGMSGRELPQLVDHPRTLPFETIVGVAARGSSQHGVWFEEATWTAVTSVGALTALRVLGVDLELTSSGGLVIGALLQRPLGRQLAQLDAFFELDRADPLRWRDDFDRAKLPLLTLRFIPSTMAGRVLVGRGPEVLVALRRTARQPELVVQLHDELPAACVPDVMRFVAQLSRGIQRAELHDFGAPPGRIRDRQRVLVERLEAMFAQLILHPAGARSFSP